jgi:DNA polymerase III subunit gamma/tau
MTQALYRKWRPKTWGEVVGQEHIVQTLRNAIAGNRVGHAYLFSGPRGTGKTTTARLLAKAVNCLAPEVTERPCDACANCLAVDEGSFLDLIEIDAASNTSVEDIRDLRDKINFSPNLGKYKVYIIDEVHMLSTAAFNALLKTLEEPPSHAIFILATTEIHKIPATVLSRCQRHEFRRVPVPIIAGLLEKKAAEEGFEVEKSVFTVIARQATGSFRDGISLLDQLASTNQKITMELAESILGTAAGQNVISLVDDLAGNDLAKGMEQIQKSLDTGADARQFARQLVDYLRNLMLIKIGDSALVDTTKDILDTMLAQSQKLDTAFIITAITAFSQAANDTRSSSWQPGLALEMALTRSLAGASQPVVEEKKAQVINRASQAVVKPTVEPPAVKSVEEKSAGKPVQVNPSPASTHEPQAGKSVEVKSNVIPTPPPGQENPSPDVAAIQQNWRKVIDVIRKLNPGTQGLVNSSRLTGIKDGCLILGFASDILKTKMESNDHLEVTRRAVQQVTGVNMPIRCVVIDSKSTSAPDERGMAGSSLVNSAINELGGQILDVKEIGKK